MRRKLIAVASAVLVVLPACSGGVDGPVIEGNRRSGGEDAEVAGVVQIEGDCIYLSRPDTDARYPVIWPKGTSWDADESAIDLPGRSELVRAGDSVYGGGGYHKEGTLEHHTTDEGIDLALRCVDNEHGEIAVFNSGGDVEIGD